MKCRHRGVPRWRPRARPRSETGRVSPTGTTDAGVLPGVTGTALRSKPAADRMLARPRPRELAAAPQNRGELFSSLVKNGLWPLPSRKAVATAAVHTRTKYECPQTAEALKGSRHRRDGRAAAENPDTQAGRSRETAPSYPAAGAAGSLRSRAGLRKISSRTDSSRLQPNAFCGRDCILWRTPVVQAEIASSR